MFYKNEEVIRKLLQRKNNIPDDSKIGLIIEGGGMRGVFGAGVCVGIEELGLRNCFDYIYSSSSGSCSGAYLLAGRGEKSTELYCKYLNGFKFIKPWKIFGKPMDLDFLFDGVCRKKKSIDTKRLKETETELKIFVTNSENGQNEYFTNRDEVDIYDLMKASCSLPFFYGPVYLNETYYMDGNIGKALPIENALTDGCTDLLVILTVPENFRKKKRNFVRRFLNFLGLLKYGNRFKKQCCLNADNYNESLDIILGRIKIHRDINIFVISPDFKLNNLEIRTKMLRQAASKGVQAAKIVFSQGEASG